MYPPFMPDEDNNFGGSLVSLNSLYFQGLYLTFNMQVFNFVFWTNLFPFL